MIETLKINKTNMTLVDQVEERLIEYFRDQELYPGCSIPSETELANALGVARTVLREALSRFKMTGMIESRTKRGMILSEPSILGGMRRCVNPRLMTPETVFNILEFRIALEVGITDYIFANITPEDIVELEQIVEMSEYLGFNRYTPTTEVHFHSKLYEITGNKIISEFQEVIHPVMDFVKDKFHDIFEPIQRELAERGEQPVTHKQLLGFLQRGDQEGYRQGIASHLKLYTVYLNKNRKK